MSMRNLVVMTVKVSKDHKDKLEDIARHDTEKSGRFVSRGSLIRAAITRLISGRKAALYQYNDKGE